jgi:hypothetical protein
MLFVKKLMTNNNVIKAEYAISKEQWYNELIMVKKSIYTQKIMKNYLNN